MARFANGDVLLILKDHSADPGNTPPNTTLWTLNSFTVWAKSVSYTVGQFVEHGDIFFVCAIANTSTNSNIPQDNSTFWTEVNEWANSVSYTVGINIVYSEIIYTCNTAHTSIYGPDENGNIDISNKFIVIEHSEDTPQSLRLVFNAKEGRFMTREPILKKFDRIYYQYTDSLGRVTKDVFHIRSIKRKRGLMRGKRYEVLCPHQSENLWKRTISIPGRKISGNEALVKITSQLNADKSTNDPIVELPSTFDLETKTGSRLSTKTSNDYIFESVKLEKSLTKIKDIEQQPVEGGGKFQAMYIRFVSKYDHSTNTDLDTVQFQAFEQGFTKNGSNFNNTPKVTLLHDTIESGNRPTVLDLDSNEDPPKATNIIALGHKKSGSYPVEFSKFSGAKDIFTIAPTIWAVGIVFERGNLVTEAGLTYEARINHTSTTPNSPANDTIITWIQRTFTKPLAWGVGNLYTIDSIIRNNDIAYKSEVTHTSTVNDEPPNDAFWIRVNFVPTVDYSPLTKDRKQDWINYMAGAKHAATNNGKTAVFDQNCIIHDDKHPRNPVRVLGTSPTAIPTEHLVGGNIPNGYKMLVVSTNFVPDPPTATDSGTGEFAGNDPNGVAFAGNIAEYRDPDEDGTGTWFVFKSSSNDEEILDIDENNSWTKNPCRGTIAYITDASVCTAGTRATTWILGSYRIINLLGFDRVQFIDNRDFDCVHKVAYDTSNSRVKVINTKISKDDTSSTSAVEVTFEPPANASLEDRRYFAGFNIWSLTPLTSNSIPYGSSPVVGNKIKLSVFDLYNMFKTHENKQEWFGPQSEDYYPINAWDFFEKLTVVNNTTGTFDLKGDYSMMMWFADQRHNVVTITYDHSRNDVTLDQDNALGKLEPYFAVPGIAVIFASPEPEIIDVFQPREWQFGGIVTKDSYDDQGRYKGKNSRFNGQKSIALILDAFRMIKPLVCTNVDEPTSKPERNIETIRQNYSGIRSYAQLKNLVLGLQKLFGFERKEIIHNTKGKNDLQYGDPVFTKDTEAFSEADNGASSNTILAVVDKIITTHSKPKRGPGGSTRRLHLITRFFP